MCRTSHTNATQLHYLNINQSLTILSMTESLKAEQGVLYKSWQMDQPLPGHIPIGK